MSSYDENGRGAMWRKTYAAMGTECESCGETIDRCTGGKLYDFDGELFCYECLFNEIFGKYKTVGYCDNCTAGYSDEDKAKNFVKTNIYPVGGRALCPECIVADGLVTEIDEDDPIEED